MKNNEAACDFLLTCLHASPSQQGIERTRWRLADLLLVCAGWQVGSTPGLCQILSRLKITYQRGRGYLTSPDPDYQAKLAQVRECIVQSAADPEHVVVLFADEFTLLRQPGLAQAYDQAGHTPLAQLGHTTNSRWRYAGALEIWSGQVLIHSALKLTLSHLLTFYQSLAAHFPRARTIYLIEDNWPIHFHPRILANLCSQSWAWPLPRSRLWKDLCVAPTGLDLPIRLIWLPTYAPWTNPIEKLWRCLKQDVLHLHRYQDDWKGLRARVDAFFAQFATGSPDLLRYVGLSDPLTLYPAPGSA